MEIKNLSLIKKLVHSITNPSEDENQKIIEQLGELLLIFKYSDLKHVKIILPTHSLDLLESSIRYLTQIDFTSNLLLKEQFTLESHHYLIDVFDNKGNPFYFNEKSTDKSIIKWSNDSLDVYTLHNEFLPVFKSNSGLHSHNEKIMWRELFRLFTVVRNEKILEFPVEFDTEEKNIILVNKSKLFSPLNSANFITFEFAGYDDSEALNDDIDKIRNCKSNLEIVFRYPYHSYLDSNFLKNDSKIFEIEFKNRFHIADLKKINDNEIYIINKDDSCLNQFELYNPVKFLTVFNTNHSNELFSLLSNLYNEWQLFNFNKYTHPFPKYFLLMVCKGQALDYWISNFQNSYPLVAEKGIFNKFVKIISLLWELDWIAIYLANVEEEVNFLFSDLQRNSISSRILKNPFTVFKNYAMSLNNGVTFNDSLENDKHNIVLNSFDYFEILNKFSSIGSDKLSLVSPDFLYYNFNSFFAYIFSNIQLKSFFTSVRCSLFDNILEQKNQAEKMLNDILSFAKEQRKNYRKKYMKQEDLEDFEDVVETLENSDEFMSEDEEIREITYQKVSNYNLSCEMVNGDLRDFKSNEFVFVKRNNIIKIAASQIEKNDFILDLREAKNNFISLFEKRLDSIPDSVKNFRRRLSEHDNVFETLKRLNLKITSKYYFINRYVSSDEIFNVEEFNLPRKEDRNVICDFLGIDYNDMNLAYLIKYRKKNEIKKLYREILNFLIDDEAFGRLSSSEVLIKVQEILLNNSISDSEEYDVKEFAEQVIENILKNLETYLLEVIAVKHNNHE